MRLMWWYFAFLLCLHRMQSSCGYFKMALSLSKLPFGSSWSLQTGFHVFFRSFSFFHIPLSLCTWTNKLTPLEENNHILVFKSCKNVTCFFLWFRNQYDRKMKSFIYVRENQCIAALYMHERTKTLILMLLTIIFLSFFTSDTFAQSLLTFTVL